MSVGSKHIVICSTSLAEYDRRIQRIAKTLSSGYEVGWISRGSLSVDWLTHRGLNPIFGKGFLFYAFFNIRLFFKLLFVKSDIICAVDLDTVLPCYLVAKLRRKTLVFDAHEYFVEVPELEGRDFVKNFWVRIEKFCLSKNKYNYTVGPELAKIFAERLGQKYEVIKNVPFKSKQKIEKKSDGKTMVYLGMVNEGRGVELAIKSLVELTDKKLKIIGSGDVEEKMKTLAKKLGVEDRVVFKGYVQPDSIELELSTCWIALNMLNPISKSYYYSLANKFFDYMHVGLPTVNMAFPEYQAINENTKSGVLASAYTSDALIEAVHKLEEGAFYSACVDNMMASKYYYSWDNESKSLLDFYADIVKILNIKN